MINYTSKNHINFLITSLLKYNNVGEDYRGPIPYFSDDSFESLVLPDGFECPPKEELESIALAAINESAWNAIRITRDKLLGETDWIITKAKETGTNIPAKWKTYRQELRDITTQEDPYNVVWPTKPE